MFVGSDKVPWGAKLMNKDHICARVAVFIPVVLALALAGCASGGARGSHSKVSVSASQDRAPAEIQGLVKKWGDQYKRRPNDKGAALNYAAALRLNGQNGQAVAVLRRAVIAHKSDREVASAYGKALASNGQFKEALTVIRNANPPANPDWRLLSAEGALLDQIGDNVAARVKYQEALKIAPDEPSVLSNMALSHVLTNDLVRAEQILRRAAASPNANSKVRQNLALVLGLQGKFQEAQAVANNELSREQAEANMAYLRSMLTQPNTWDRIKAQDKEKKQRG